LNPNVVEFRQFFADRKWDGFLDLCVSDSDSIFILKSLLLPFLAVHHKRHKLKQVGNE